MARPIVEHIIDGKQICRRCKEDKIVDQFWKNKNKPTGISQYCNICSNLNRQETRIRVTTGTQKHKIHGFKKESEEYKAHTRSQCLKYNYGITVTNYNKMFTDQKGCCAICSIHQSELKKPLHVDHNHISGEVRGLLCYQCNMGLGIFKDDIDLFNIAIKYLKENNSLLKLGNLNLN